jgi:hypothetical protein
MILSRSTSAVAASNWITQGQLLPQVPGHERMTITAQTYYGPYWVYGRNWLWHNWYRDDFFAPYPYHDADEYFNYTGVKMGLDANVSVELGAWTIY